MDCEEKIQKVEIDCITVQNLQGMIRLNTTDVTARKKQKNDGLNLNVPQKNRSGIYEDQTACTEQNPATNYRMKKKRTQDYKDARMHSACCF